MSLDKKEIIYYNLKNSLRQRYFKNNQTEIQKMGFNFKFGDYSKSEVIILDNLVKTFLKKNNLTIKNLKDDLVKRSDFPRKELLQFISNNLEQRTLRSIFDFYEFYYHPYKKSKFNKEADEIILNHVKKNGNEFKSLEGDFLLHKSKVRMRYLNLLDDCKKNITHNFINKICKEKIPTEEEINEICKKYKMKKPTLEKHIKKYIKGKTFNCKNLLNSLKICILILNNNHFCNFNKDVNLIMSYLEENNEKALKSYFNNEENLDLEIEIKMEDIFIKNISEYLEIPYNKATTEIKGIKTEYQWKSFKNIFDTTNLLIKEFYLEKLKIEKLNDKK